MHFIPPTLTAGYALLMGSTVLKVYVVPPVIGHVIPCALHTLGLATGNGTGIPSIIPSTTVVAAVMLVPAKESGDITELYFKQK